VFLERTRAICASRRIELATHGLPPGVQRLLALAAVPDRAQGRREAPFVSRIGAGMLENSGP
jgi:hypothetical protein